MSGSGDYISREAATTLFARACGECKEACEEFDGFYADCNQCLLHGVLKEFATIPAADVRPVRRGKWKTQKASIHPYGNDVCCSECGFTMGSSFGYRFCPNCGAKNTEVSDG